MVDPGFDADITRRPVFTELMDRGELALNIRMDIERALSRVQFFSKKPIGEDVEQVIKMCMHENPTLEWVSGIAYIAGLLVSYLDPTPAFWCLSRAMESKEIQLRKILNGGLEGMNMVWQVVLDWRFPRVGKYFKKLELTPLMYSSAWFLTAFLAIDLRPEIKLMIFDRFLMYGFRAVLSFALVVVGMQHHELKRMPLEECLKFLRSPDESWKFADWRAVLAKYDQLWISERDYPRYLRRASVNIFD
jgi:hypothetical protein